MNIDEEISLYPFLFKPILKKVIWGGSDICLFKEIPLIEENIGESWEISHVEDNISIVDNGELKEKNLDQLIAIYGDLLLGEKVRKKFGTTFPLLIKFIDAKDDLSVQVHPNDVLAKKRHNSFGKTEMWYVIKTNGEATLYSGFSHPVDGNEYAKRVDSNTLLEVLQQYKVTSGDVFFLPAGRIHAIGAGCFVAEIQQTSNITYRIYDYDRVDTHGNKRELHTDLAKDAIDYTWLPDYRTHYEVKKNTEIKLTESPYFRTNLLDLDCTVTRKLETLDSFVIYICLEGNIVINDNKGNKLEVHQGQTILVPADTKFIVLNPSLTCKLLETYIE